MSSSPGCSTSSPDDDDVREKSTKIKNWAKNRMKELEEQNERLRLQNLRCTTQLQMLRSYTEKSRELKSEMAMSRSITGTLPVMRDSDNRTSDDSGLTSDEPDRRKGTGGAGVRLRKEISDVSNPSASTSSSSGEPSPSWEGKAPPIPTPRAHPNNNLERDSLNSSADDYGFDVEEDELFDEIESPRDRQGNKFADYVNLADFVSIRDDDVIYSDVIKGNDHAPTPPRHAQRKWESKLFESADKCLLSSSSPNSSANSSSSPHSSASTSTETPSASASPYHVGRISMARTDSPASRRSASSKMSALSSPRVLSHHSASPSTTDGHYAVRDLDGEYYIPPDASRDASRLSGDCRTSLVPSLDTVEKSGYWNQVSDSRLKSLKRRFVVLKNNCLTFYRKSPLREDEPLMRMPISDVTSVVKLVQQGSSYAFQLSTTTSKMQFMTDSERTTQEWVSTLSAAVKGATLRDLATRSAPLDASMSGWLTRVRCGHSKRMWGAVVRERLMFFKNHDDTVPNGYLHLHGARISDKPKGSSDEYSGSSDEQQLEEQPKSISSNTKKDTYSLSIEIANEDPVYLVLRSSEEKEKWLYFLRAAAGDANLFGTPFEILIQRMLAEGAHHDSPLWKDLLLISCDDTPKDTLTSVAGESDRKKAVEIAKACFLFVSVLMRPMAVQYHIDLAQNILSTSIQHDYLKNEFYAQMLRLTSGSMPFALQGWKLLALALPLFLPKQYALLWMLRKHITRWSLRSGDESNMAGYCKSALERGVRMGARFEGPSRLEVTSLLTRDPTTTKFPHSISVKLPNQQYQVVEFDGSTEVGQCLSSLCLRLGMRPALLSGYALYIDDPATKGVVLLKGKQKVCDALSIWELRQRDILRGRIPSDCRASLSLRLRHYWTHLLPTETPIERSFLVWRMADEILSSRLPLSSSLAEQLAALYAQLCYGDISTPSLSDEQFEFVSRRFFPAKMLDVACIKSLRASFHSNWTELSGMSEAEAVNVILQVLRRWPLFGCDIYSAGMRTSNDRRVFLALTDTAIHILDHRHFDTIRSFPYHRLSSFGSFHDDFMLTVEREVKEHPEEGGKERLTFSMNSKELIEQLTLHLAEYIRCQKLVWKVSK